MTLIEKVIIAAIAAILLLIIVSSCSHEEEQPVAVATPPPVQQQVQPVVQQPTLQPQELQPPPYQQPVIINQPAPSAPAHDSTMTDMLLGGLIGHAIGSSGRGAIPTPNPYPQQVVRQTVVRKVYVQPRPSTSYTPRTTFRSSSYSSSRSSFSSSRRR